MVAEDHYNMYIVLCIVFELELECPFIHPSTWMAACQMGIERRSKQYEGELVYVYDYAITYFLFHVFSSDENGANPRF